MSKVKWFSQEKGYGYITNKHNNDLYFGVKDIIGPDLTENGDLVSYEEIDGRAGVKSATNVVIIEKKNPEFKKLKCDSCKIKVAPRIWHYGGSDYTNMKTQHLCPNCGYSLFQTGGGFNSYTKFFLITISISMFVIAYITY
jgi:cold shock CspA family protein